MVAWDTLRAAGVPIGAVRRVGGGVDPADVRAAITAAIEEPLLEPERAALHAWLAALAHHWPARFDRLAGGDGRKLLARFDAEPFDANRYLKLRRVAIENLAGLVERPAA